MRSITGGFRRTNRLLRDIMGESTGRRFYVDATLGNDANTGVSPSSAWQTLGKVNTYTGLRAGDQVLFKRGESWTSADQYSLTISISGLTLGAYGSGNDPIIANTNGGFNAYCLRLTGNNVHVEEMKFTTAREGAVRVEGGNCDIAHCEMTACGSGLVVVGANTWIHDNNIHNLTIVRSTVGGDDDYGAVGVWLYEGSDGSRIYDNTFSYCIALSSDYGTDGGAIEVWGTVDNIQVYRNLAIHCCGFSEFGAPTGGGDTVTNFRVFNNIAIECGWLAFINTADGTYGTSIEGLSFEHNTIVSPRAHAIAFRTTTEPSGDNLIVRNNLFLGHIDFAYNGEGFTHDHNLHSGNGPAVLGTGEIELTDPLLDAAPLVDMNFDVGMAYTVDADHVARDQGADSTSDATKFAINASYALNGTAYGVRVTVPTGTIQFNCTKNVKVPSDISEAWVEFWLDPNTITLNAGDEFIAAADYLGSAPWQTWKFQVDKWASPYRYVVYAVNDDETSQNANGTFSDAPHQIRVHLTRASSAVAADGTATWYIDNMTTPVSSMTGLDNYDIFPLIQAYQFGMLYSAALTAAGGTYYIDGFRTTFSAGLGTNVAADCQPGVSSPALGAGVTSDILTDYGNNLRANPPTIGAWE